MVTRSPRPRRRTFGPGAVHHHFPRVIRSRSKRSRTDRCGVLKIKRSGGYDGRVAVRARFTRSVVINAVRFIAIRQHACTRTRAVYRRGKRAASTRARIGGTGGRGRTAPHDAMTAPRLYRVCPFVRNDNIVVQRARVRTVVVAVPRDPHGRFDPARGVGV